MKQTNQRIVKDSSPNDPEPQAKSTPGDLDGILQTVLSLPLREARDYLAGVLDSLGDSTDLADDLRSVFIMLDESNRRAADLLKEHHAPLESSTVELSHDLTAPEPELWPDRLPSDSPLHMALSDYQITKLSLDLGNLEDEIKAASALLRATLNELWTAYDGEDGVSICRELATLNARIDLAAKFAQLDGYWRHLRKSQPGGLQRSANQPAAAAA